MEARIHVITLGVRELERSIRFYRDGLGWPMSSVSGGDFAIFKTTTGTALALFPRHLLAADARVDDKGGFGGITLAHNVVSKKEVEAVLVQAVRAGGCILKAASDTEWGDFPGILPIPMVIHGRWRGIPTFSFKKGN